MIERFDIAISDAVLSDLKRRLDETRWAPDFANDDWRYGANTYYIRGLVDYWRKDYDWRAREALMNEFAHFRTTIDGIPVHFIHQRAKGRRPIPLMLNHGWPWSFWDLRELIGPLSDPANYGGDPEDAFEIIAPSLPGYGFSTPLSKPGINFCQTAEMWVELMRRLGHSRFACHGADWGAIVSEQLGHKYADHLIGIHIQTIVPLDLFTKGQIDPAYFEPDNLDQLEKNSVVLAEELGYFALQSTRPQTPAIGLHDSPAGLLAWLVEKRRAWSDCGGDVENRFSKDELIDLAMIYWVTESYGTSARYYYEAVHKPWTPSHDRIPVIEAPTAIADFPRDIVRLPRKWAEQYFNLQRWTIMPAGGHFGLAEEPQAIIEDIREFFRPMR